MTNLKPFLLRELCEVDRSIVEPDTELAKKLPYLSLEHVESGSGRITRDSTSVLDDEGASTTFHFNVQHVLYGKLRPYLNKVALPSFEGRCTTEIIPLKPTKLVDREYLALILRSNTVVSAATRFQTGSRMPRADLDQLLNLEIHVPSIEIQRERVIQIKDRLCTVSLATQYSNEQLRDLLLLARSSFREQFEECIPIFVTRVNSVPKNWRVAKLLDLAQLESGHTPSRRHPEWWGGKVPWLSLTDIRKLDGKFAYETGEYTNEAGLANSSARLLPTHTVCLSRTASVGFVTILGKPMATSQDFVNWICDEEKLEPEFLMYAFMASRNYLLELGSGAVHKSIYMPALRSFHVCAPSISEQRRIAHTLRERFAAAETLASNLRARLNDIEQLPQRLLAATFGEVQ